MMERKLTAARSWTLGAVGDVFIHRPDPENAFAHATPMLRSVDLLFGNCEGVYSDRPGISPGAGWVVMSKRHCASVLGPAGFDIMSCANNHILDGGYEGLQETLAALSEQGISTIGAGPNVVQAREPAIVERNGVKLGFLAFSCVHPPGYSARPRMPGVAAIRIHSHYYMKDENPYGYVEPGVAPDVMTVPWTEDVEFVNASISSLKQKTDLVVVSFHWGSSRYPGHIMEYEKFLGHSAVDSGADIVLGHHHHLLRGVELYRDRPIFYGLGHFVFDQDTDWSPEELSYLKSLGEYGIYPREGYPLLPFHPDGRLTMMAVFKFTGKALTDIGFVPCVISPDNHAVPAASGTREYERVLEYVRNVSKQVGFATEYQATDWLIGGFEAIRVQFADL